MLCGRFASSDHPPILEQNEKTRFDHNDQKRNGIRNKQWDKLSDDTGAVKNDKKENSSTLFQYSGIRPGKGSSSLRERHPNKGGTRPKGDAPSRKNGKEKGNAIHANRDAQLSKKRLEQAERQWRKRFAKECAETNFGGVFGKERGYNHISYDDVDEYCKGQLEIARTNNFGLKHN
jgi:hypothetical protein